MTVLGSIHTITFTAVQCPSCSIWFGVEAGQEGLLRTNGETFYCPNGHSQWYGESEADRLKKRLKYAENDAARARSLAETERQSKIAYKGRVTRLKNQFAQGKCPECGYGFQNLTNHMAAKHPHYEASND